MIPRARRRAQRDEAETTRHGLQQELVRGSPSGTDKQRPRLRVRRENGTDARQSVATTATLDFDSDDLTCALDDEVHLETPLAPIDHTTIANGCSTDKMCTDRPLDQSASNFR